MPNISVQLRRGTTTEHNTFTGAEGEVTVDTDLDTLRVHDGSTAGGIRLAKHSELAGAAGNTDLGNSPTATNVEITSSTGTNTTVAGASTSLAGVMTGADKTKLNGIATGATANSSDATLLSRANHTGTQLASTISNFDTEVANNSAVAANTAKVSNATHTGDVTGSTALTIANNAVTSAKIATGAVTFAKMQDISTATVIGRTAGGSGDPQEVSILDEDTMVSNSATALATQQSIKAYVDAQLVSKYSSGWVNTDGTTSVANGATLSFTHNLGTTDLIVKVYMANNSSGSNAVVVQAESRDGAGTSVIDTGGLITGITTTGLTLQLQKDGWFSSNTSGTRTGGAWGTTYTHIKVVAIA